MQDGIAHEDRPALEARLASIQAEVEQLSTQLHGPSGLRGRLAAYAERTGELIKRHPLASATVAFGLGYLVVRAVRR